MAATEFMLELLAEAPGSPQLTDIERREAQSLSYNEFFWQHMNANWPVVLTEVSTQWECRQRWTLQPSNGNNDINFDYLREKIGNRPVPVANCSSKYFNSHEKCEMPFFDFLDYWQAKISTNSVCANSNEADNCDNTKNLYLKDWHLKAQLPAYEFYRVPRQFAADWLNEHLVDNDQDDYRFVYMGPKGTWTPFHADVFGSYSWSTNILGCKKWILLPPGEEQKLTDRLGNFPFSIDETLLQQHHVQFYTLHQRENEAIFVPSGWYHQVWNLTDTISVNHNWFNACNVQRIWCNLATNMQLVVAEIDDCRQMSNFDEHCQTMLRASFGLNYLDFLHILQNIAERRMQQADIETTSSKPLLYATPYALNDFHRRYDLESIACVLTEVLQNSVVCDSRTLLYRKCLKLLDSIRNFKC